MSKFKVSYPGPSVEMTVEQSGEMAKFTIEEQLAPAEYKELTGTEPRNKEDLYVKQTINVGRQDLRFLVEYLRILDVELMAAPFPEGNCRTGK